MVAGVLAKQQLNSTKLFRRLLISMSLILTEDAQFLKIYMLRENRAEKVNLCQGHYIDVIKK